jgi:hypothetical protein
MGKPCRSVVIAGSDRSSLLLLKQDVGDELLGPHVEQRQAFLSSLLL